MSPHANQENCQINQEAKCDGTPKGNERIRKYASMLGSTEKVFVH